MTVASLPCGPAPASAPAAAAAGWTAFSSAAGPDCAEAGTAAFGDLLQMLGGTEPSTEGLSGGATGEGWRGLTINANAELAPEAASGVVQRQLLPHGITLDAARMSVMLEPAETLQTPVDAPQQIGADLQLPTPMPELVAEATQHESYVETPQNELAAAQPVVEHIVPEVELQAAGVPVDTVGAQSELPEAQLEASGQPVDGADGDGTIPDGLPIPAAPVTASDSAGASRIRRTLLSGDADIAAEESEKSEEPEVETEVPVLALAPAPRDETPVPKVQADVSCTAEQRAQTPLLDPSAVRQELAEPVPGRIAPNSGRADEVGDLAFSAKLVEHDRPAGRPEAAEAPQVLRMVESTSPVSAHIIAPAASAGVHTAHEYAAQPAYQSPVVMEPVSPAEAPHVASGPAHELRLSIAPESGAVASRVEVRVSERAGEVRVAVQSPDPNVRAAVRSDLSNLVSRLEQAGYKAEVTQPQAGRVSDEVTVAEVSRARAGSDSDHNPASADTGSRDSSGWDSNEGRRERREAPPRPFAPARPKAPGRRFFDEFIR